MHTAARVLVGLIAVEHLWFLVLESFLWRTPFGRRTFGNSVELAEATWRLAANQGLYNGFLAAGLGWSLWVDAALAFPLQLFFLGCVLVAGVVGGVTAKRSILFLQALPALAALIVVLEAR
jgi:putative membrane protein